MSKLWEAIKDLERKRESAAAGNPPREAADVRERCVAYLEEIRGKWRRHATVEDEQ